MGSQQWGNTGGSQKQPQALKWRVDGRDGRQRLDPFRLPIERSKLSEFVLVPVTAAARNSCRSLHRRGDGVAVPAASASAAVATTTATTTPPPPPLWIPLLDGDNIVGTGVGHGLGLGIPVGTEVRQHVYFTHKLLLCLLAGRYCCRHTKHQQQLCRYNISSQVEPGIPTKGAWYSPRLYIRRW